MNYICIAPGLADIAPVMMNYFYDNGGPNNCFAAGPSGAQYITPYSHPGSNEGTGDYLFNTDYTDYFTRLTEKYLKRTGLRVVTVWHNASDTVRASFEKNCRYLYGVTLQNRGPFASATANNHLRFEKLTNDYCDDITTLESSLKNSINNWSGSKPLFLSAQLDSWNRKVGGNVAVADLVKFAGRLCAAYPNYRIEFVRADHWFSLYNEANGLPFNLCMSLSTKVTSSGGDPLKAVDGSTSTWWKTPPDEKYIAFDFGRTHKINRYVIRYREVAEMATSPYSANSWTVQVSADNSAWTVVDTRTGNTLSVIDMDIAPVEAQYLRIDIPDRHRVSITDIEIYGSVDN